MPSSFALRHVRRFSISSISGAAAAVESSPLSITRNQYASKMKTEHDPDKVLEMYTELSKLKIPPLFSRHAQDLTVKRLAKASRFNDIETLIEAKKNDPKVKQEPYVATLIRSYGLARMFDHALKTFDQMDELGTPRTAVSFNALLSACNFCKLFDKVPQLFDEMPLKYGVVPDKVSYGMLVKSYCDAGLVEKGLERVKEMEEKGIEVTVITFTTILHCLYKKRNIAEAESFWDEMTSKGLLPDTGAYNVLVMNACDGKPEDVLELIEKMKQAGLKPDTVSYNYLMTCYCKNGMISEAKKVYEGLGSNGCNPHGATFVTLIYHLCKNEMYDYGYKVFRASLRANKMPDFRILKPLVVGLAKSTNKRHAKEIISIAKRRYPPKFLETWAKVEEDLGLVGESEASSDDVQEVAQEVAV